VAIICVQEAHWDALRRLAGRDDLKDDPRFATQGLRAQHEDAVDAVVEAWTRTLPKAEIARLCRENRVPAAPVRDLTEVVADRHMHERGMLHDVDHPTFGRVTLPTSPIRFHGSPDPTVGPEPAIGEHTDAVLRDWLGYDGDRMATLRAAGAIG